MRAIPVTVVTGFLGAGKTTLLNAWLASRRDVAVIVNEVGAIGIDGELLASPGRTLIEIAGGCVCCTTHADLVRALAMLAARAPARIFVETSGAASPAGVVRAIAREESLRLEGIVTVVDGTRLSQLLELELAIEQIAYADVLVVTRRCDDETRAQLAHRNGAAVIATERAELEPLLARRNGDFEGALASHAADGGIESIALELEGEVDEERFGEWIESELSRFASRLLRMKGILAVEGLEERMILQGVAERVEVTFGAPWGERRRSSRLVILGFALDRDELERGFRATGVRSAGDRGPERSP
jgi:G3E family GTPase